MKSLSRSSFLRVLAIWVNNSSPAIWPHVSLIILNWSRSIQCGISVFYFRIVDELVKAMVKLITIE